MKTRAMRLTLRLPGASRPRRHGRNCIVCIHHIQNDSLLEHHAMWPAVQRVIHKHATWGTPIVMEGWSLWPERVIQLRLPSVHALWLVAHEETLQARMGKAEAFYGGASDEEAMRQQYLARSFWYN